MRLYSAFLGLMHSLRSLTFFQWLMILSIICLCMLRIAFLDLMEFKYDEQEALRLVAAQFETHRPAQIGLPSSAGLMNSPFFIWLLTLPFFLSSNPFFIAIFIALLNIIGIALLYLCLRKYAGNTIALWTTSLFASAPWGIVYARKIWAQDLLFPFFITLVFVLMSLIEQYKPWKVIALFALTAILTQLHMSAWAVPATLVCFLFLTRTRTHLRDVIIGFFMVAILYSPYILYHIQTHGLNILSTFEQTSPQSFEVLSFIYWSLSIATGNGFDYLIGQIGMDLLTALPLFWIVPWIFWLFMISAAVTCAYFFFQALETVVALVHKQATSKKSLMILFLIMHLCITTFFLFILQKPVYPHYAIILYPVVPLLFSMGLEIITEQSKRKTIVAHIMIGIIVLSHVIFFSGFLVLLSKNSVSAEGDYGIPYRFHIQ